MQQEILPISIHSYAFKLRKNLLERTSLQGLLECHTRHQEFLGRVSPLIDSHHLSPSDRFAWKLLREINILSLDFSSEGGFSKLITDPSPQASQGIYLNLEDVVVNVQKIWFPEMETAPKIAWLKHFSTRKLAHYSYKKDEIAFSLIFDSLDAPAEIVSYLAYHELLHRQLGAKKVNGRHYSHTIEFKAHEHLFPNWRSIDKQLNHYILNTV
ncbi:MAG: hypothetical protein HQ517_10820 [SAR324 cluster bacterium]|nr:hypothetical protein [SAR324 cluster bacterium]